MLYAVLFFAVLMSLGGATITFLVADAESKALTWCAAAAAAGGGAAAAAAAAGSGAAGGGGAIAGSGPGAPVLPLVLPLPLLAVGLLLPLPLLVVGLLLVVVLLLVVGLVRRCYRCCCCCCRCRCW
jgi:hypothetical protein